MARTAEQVQRALKESARQSNPAVDVDKGPLYDWVIAPVSNVLPSTEETAERLAKIYSADFASIATEEEASAFTTNWGESAGLGAAAGTVVYFMKYSRPSTDEVITVRKGDLVSNNDATLQYVALETKSITGVNADSFYNAQRRTYEIGVNVVAVANGSGYELPSGRINRMITQIKGIDAVENRIKASGGTESETTVQQIQRVQEKFKGLAINTPSGGVHRILRYDTANIFDVVPVTSSNRNIFKRITFKPATDYYVLGETLTEVTQVYVSTLGGEKEIPLEYVPCKSISKVLVNNVTLTNYYLSQDMSLDTGFSAQSQDKLILDTPLLLGDVVLITMTYNKLLNDIQVGVLSETKLFHTDELAREFRKIPVIIEISAKVLPNYEPTQVESDLLAELESLLTVRKHVDEIMPGAFLEKIRERVGGISSPAFYKFKRATKSNSEVEMLTFDKNEIPYYDPQYVTITLRSV